MHNIHYLLVFCYVENLYILLLFILALMYVPLYTGSLFNSFLIKLLILFHISEYYSNIFLSVTKRFMYLLFLSKYFVYAFI